MKYIKYLISVALLGATVSSFGASATMTLTTGQFTNFTGLNLGNAKVTSIIFTATTATNASIQAYDTPTNTTVYTNSAYTNVLSYATNSTLGVYFDTNGNIGSRSVYTNYYGVVYTNTNNIILVDTANTVASVTNNYPLRFAITAAASTTVIATPVAYQFNSGIWITNNGTGTAQITISYTQ